MKDRVTTVLPIARIETDNNILRGDAEPVNNILDFGQRLDIDILENANILC